MHVTTLTTIFDNTMEIEKTLLDLGLSPQEAGLYLVLLKTGGMGASAAAKEAGMQRTTAYAILKNLVHKGFVLAYIRKGRQVFVAEKPQQIAGYYEKKLKSFTERIPFLESIEKKHLQTTGLRFIESVDELRRFYASILREYHGRSYLAMGNTASWQGLDPDFFIQYRKDRAEALIKTKLLLTADSRESSPTASGLLREIKFLPAKYPFKSTMDIFDDKVLIVSPDQTSLAVVIAVPAMVDIFRSSFQMIWDLLPETGKKQK